MLAGYLFCSDCGAALNYKRPSDKPWNEYFSCHNNRQHNGLWDTSGVAAAEVRAVLSLKRPAGVRSSQPSVP
jgi:hypothetical protein